MPYTFEHLGDESGVGAQEFLNGWSNVLRFGSRGEAFTDFSRFIYKKFGEVPFDSFRSQETWRFIFQMLIEGMGIRAIDFDLGKHGEGDTVIGLTKFLDFFMTSWILTPKLIAWKP